MPFHTQLKKKLKLANSDTKARSCVVAGWSAHMSSSYLHS